MADYVRDHEISQKTKLFYVDFTPLIVHAHQNLIYILNPKQMQIISVHSILHSLDS